MSTTSLSAQQIESLALGAWILGTGGGGSPYHGFLNLRRLYKAGARVQVMDPADLADDAAVAVASTMGAPLVMQERVVDPGPSASDGQTLLPRLPRWATRVGEMRSPLRAPA